MTNYIALAIPLFFILIAVEYLWAKAKGMQVYRINDAVSNISCGIGQQLTGILFKTALFFSYFWLYEHARLFSIPEELLWWFVLFIGVDFCYYWFHRFSHEVNMIWATHIVHHQSEDYNLSVALRQSSFQGFFSLIFYLPLAVLGFSPLMTLTVIAINTLYQFWIHTELIRTMGWFEWIFNTPSHHRVHHGSNPEYIDKNHGGTFIIWDRLFGTFQQELKPVVYGITTPLKSWDPLHANVHYWRDLIQQAKKLPGITNKIKVFVMPPGWNPLLPGGREVVREVDKKNFVKFDIPVPIAVPVYVSTQFLLIVALSTYVLFVAGSPLSDFIISLIVFNLFSVFSLGKILELSRLSLYLESLRFLIILGIVWFLNADWFLPSIIIALFSIITFWSIWRNVRLMSKA